MPLFMPQDPPDAMGEFKPLGPPLPRTEEPGHAKPLYQKTGTPGVVKNTETGKLETILPEPKRSVLSDKTLKMAREIIEALEAKQFIFQDEDLWLLKQSNSFVIEESSTFASSQQRVFSTPQLSGKSLIVEMYSRYGSQTNASQLFQEEKKLNGSRPQLSMMDDSQQLEPDDGWNWSREIGIPPPASDS